MHDGYDIARWKLLFWPLALPAATLAAAVCGAVTLTMLVNHVDWNDLSLQTLGFTSVALALAACCAARQLIAYGQFRTCRRRTVTLGGASLLLAAVAGSLTIQMLRY